MKVAILGAGAIARGNAAYLCRDGHDPVLWSPSGRRLQAIAAGEPLVATGAIEGRFHPRVAASCAEALADAEVVLIALPANGHRQVMEAAAAHLRPGQSVIISSHISFSGLYLARLLAARGVRLPIIVWGTTLTAGRQSGDAGVNVSVVRAKLDAAVLPVAETARGLALCRTLFGERFEERADMLAIALSNLNPQNHLGIALCNFTRMENGEAWEQNRNLTDSVGRLLEALDGERLAIAAALGYRVRTVREHYHLSFHVAPGPIGEMARALVARGDGIRGPATTATRYVLEDAPYGLYTTVVLGRLAGIATPLHEGGVHIFSALYGRDLAADNDLLPALGLETLGLDRLRRLVRDGWREGGE